MASLAFHVAFHVLLLCLTAGSDTLSCSLRILLVFSHFLLDDYLVSFRMKEPRKEEPSMWLFLKNRFREYGRKVPQVFSSLVLADLIHKRLMKEGFLT